MNPQPAPPPELTVPPEAVQVPVDVNGSGSGPAKKIFAVAGILVTLIIVAGGLIYLRNQKQAGVAPLPGTTVNAFEDLQKEAESADVGSDNDMTDLDKDLNSL